MARSFFWGGARASSCSWQPADSFFFQDAQKLWSKPWWTSLRCVAEGQVFAADGNRYFARPGPSLVAGVAILARIMQDRNPAIVKAIEATDLSPAQGTAWDRVHAPASVDGSLPDKMDQDIEDLCWSLHKAACDRGERFYLDPATGFQVFTEVAHKSRGKCCGCGCRHCPYSHAGVPMADRAKRIQQPAWLHKALAADEVDLLFWSGGKDSFLTLRTIQRESDSRRDAVFVTTFDARTRVIAHQEVEIETVVRQARALGASLVGVPLQTGLRYEDQVRRGLEIARQGLAGRRVVSVCFGDLHLEHIRSWREKALSPIVQEVFGGAAMRYPLWKVPYEVLMADLLASGVPCRISAMPDAPPSAASKLFVGARFGPEVAQEATAIGWDAFGENGEFHSVAEPWKRASETEAAGHTSKAARSAKDSQAEQDV